MKEKKLAGHCSRLKYGWILSSSNRLQKLNYLFMCQVVMVYLQGGIVGYMKIASMV